MRRARPYAQVELSGREARIDFAPFQVVTLSVKPARGGAGTASSSSSSGKGQPAQ